MNGMPNDSTEIKDVSADQAKQDIDTIMAVLERSLERRSVHESLTAWGNFITALLFLTLLPVTFFFYGMFDGNEEIWREQISSENFDTLLLLIWLFLGVICLCALPFALAAWAIFAGSRSNLFFVLIASLLHILNFPLGSLFGVYSLWAMLSGKIKYREKLIRYREPNRIA